MIITALLVIHHCNHGPRLVTILIDGIRLSYNAGYSVSLPSYGRTVAIGAYELFAQAGGHVIVYYFNSTTSSIGTWSQVGQLIRGENAGDWFDFSVSLADDGRTVAIGAHKNGGNGSNAGQDIDGEQHHNNSGYHVSLSNDGRIVAIGARHNGDNGSNSGSVRVYIFKNNDQLGEWTQVDGESAHDYFGYSVSLSGEGRTVAVVAGGVNGSDSGHLSF